MSNQMWTSCNLCTWETEPEGQGHPGLYRGLQSSLDYSVKILSWEFKQNTPHTLVDMSHLAVLGPVHCCFPSG